MQIVSFCALASFLALQLCAVSALPLSLGDMIDLHARSIGSSNNNDLKARYFSNGVQRLDARELAEANVFDARDFDYEHFNRRTLAKTLVKVAPKVLAKHKPHPVVNHPKPAPAPAPPANNAAQHANSEAVEQNKEAAELSSMGDNDAMFNSR